MATSKADKN